MIIAAVRSPYQVVIDKIDQVATKVEVFLWNKNTLQPPHPTYIMSEKIASITQRETNYNISPFALEYIKQIDADYNGTSVAVEDDGAWCFMLYKTYYSLNGVDFNLIDEQMLICVNGYTLAEQGVNFDYANSQKFRLLINNNINLQYSTPAYYYNFLCERDASNDYTIEYYKNNVLVYSETFLTAGADEYYNFKIPVGIFESDYTEIRLNGATVAKFASALIKECKYTPVVVSFVNRYGGWIPLMCYKASQNSIDTKGTEYNLMPESWDYNYLEGQSRSMNINGTKTIKCNTGFVDEDYDNLITDLLLSDTIYVNFKPAVIKSKSMTLKTHIKDKNINYTLEFEFSNNLLNNIV